ncbi:MAG: tripartite tricarboxylate transporter TctB family protein [Lautropia sp.]
MGDRLLGALCVAVACAMAWAAQGYAAEISYEPVGPRAFPMLLALLMALGGFWLLAKPAGRDRPPSPHGAAPGSAAGSAVDGAPPAPWSAIVLVSAALIGFAVLFQLLGFTLATALMAIPVGMAFGGSWKQSLAGGVGLGLCLYLLFDRLLDVVLPTGLLAIVFGGR